MRRKVRWVGIEPLQLPREAQRHSRTRLDEPCSQTGDDGNAPILYRRFPFDTLGHQRGGSTIVMGRTLVARICVLPAVFLLLIAGHSSVSAEYVLELPILAAVKSNGQGVFEVLMLHWDQRAEPIPASLQWRVGNVVLGNAHLSSMATAFRYAIERTPGVHHSGTVTAIGLAYMPTGSDGPSAGAAMAVGFMALFKGDRIHRGIAMTGTLHPDGSVGPVGSIPDKVRAAVREGYRTILIPSGQLRDPEWNLIRLGMELNVDLKEVGTIEEAYQLMTGRPP